MGIRTLVWGENIHEQVDEAVRRNYPDGMHNQIARLLAQDAAIEVSTATLQEHEHGCTEQRLAATDVLVWWGHAGHGEVSDAVVERIAEHVWQGMGLIVLHSAHYSKIFKRLMGTPCGLSWREAGERERIWVVNPGHPICEGLPPHFELEMEEMYGEPFAVPEPLETVLISWFQGGEVFRSGVTYRRGAGNVFYFRPGHETYPTYYNETVGRILQNSVLWAHCPGRHSRLLQTPNIQVTEALEPIADRGAKIHAAGHEGYR